MTLPLVTAAVVAVVALLPSVTPSTPADHARRLGVAALGAAACALDGPLAGGLLAVATALHAPFVRSRIGAAALLLAAALHATAAGAIAAEAAEVALAASLFAIALRGGVIPLHPGTSSLAERAPGALVELGATSVAAVVVHLRDVLPLDRADGSEAAVPIVLAGALAALVSGVGSLTRTSLRGLWSSSVSMHGGMLLAAAGAAGRGHFAGAVFVSIAFALSLGGFGLMLAAVEARTGPVDLRFPGGRSQRFPRATWAFAFFAAASVALPGTVGFAADDLLLHALWEESGLACGLVLAASALLAVGLLRGWSAAFLGAPARTFTAADLSPREGAAVAALAAMLVVLGLRPMWLLTPTLAAFGH